MQSGYGGVSEMQQFLVDGCGTTLFSISPPPPPPPPTNPTVTTDIHTTPSQPGLKYHPFHHPHHLHPHPHPHHQPPPPAPPHFPHFHPIPITQQLFQQTHHQFQLFHHQSHDQRRSIPGPHHHHHHHHHPGLDPESGPENSTSPTRMMVGAAGGGDRERGPPPPPFLASAMNFKLAVNESSGGGSGEGMNDEEGILQGDDGSESRFHPWQREEESAIKEPFWRPLDIDYINRNNKRCKDKEPESSTNTYCKKSKDGSEAGQENPTTGSNYKLFSELEAIYKPGGGGNYQTGSGSALTGDENPLVAAMPPGPAGDPRDAAAGSDTSTHGGETPAAASKLPKGGGSGGRRKRKRRQQQQMSSIAVFFEGLVKQLMDHQEVLHRKFLEVMERRDQERTGREEAWRRQEAAKSAREAAARAEERALSATREAAIISFLEKVTGESLNLPTKSQFQSQLLDETQKEDNNTDVNIPWETSDPFTTTTTAITTTINNNSDNRVQLNTSRWPRTEVQALIRVRSALEMRFQEPGLKGPLWEEVSSMMGSMGYQRSSKRCKEKWENINKYFRKTKDSGKKRPQHSKTCPYFQQLDQLYSNTKSLTKANAAPNPMERRDNSELLDAIVVSTDLPTNFNSGPLRIDFNGKAGDKAEPSGSAMAAKESNDNDDNDNEDDDDEEGGYEEADEGEGESQGQWQEQQQHLQNLHT